MKAPGFWQHDGPLARALAPLGWLYDIAGRVRAARTTAERAGVPVICVGNATAGGTGKTPVAMDLVRRLQLQGVMAQLLTRGYGGRTTGPHLVNPWRDSAAAVGDEPLLLARAAPTWVARDRAAGARAAVDDGAQALVLDDGLQNPALAKDLSLLLVDGAAGFGNGRVIPAGPLRERLSRALARADAAVLLGRDRAGVAGQLPAALPQLGARLEADSDGARQLAGVRALAFCGIGRPEKFFDTLRAVGVEVVETRAFADHHAYRPSELTGLLELARRGGLAAVTTEKDAMRLPDWARARVATLPIRVCWDDPDRLEALLRDTVERGRAG
jgi:tetraacyldisaccharide 4'-kinase